MIREHDEGAGKARQPFNAREMLQRMERLLSQTRSTRQKQADEAGFSTVFAWCRVLERLLSGDPAAAAQALAVARKQNPHIQVYIKGHRDLPRQMPDSYSMGSKEEAICFAEVLRAAWKKHPAALQWLETQKVK